MEDFSSEVTRAHKEFSGLCSRLVKENRKFAFLFPARLPLLEGNSLKDFSSVDDAEAYCREVKEAERPPLHSTIVDPQGRYVIADVTISL